MVMSVPLAHVLGVLTFAQLVVVSVVVVSANIAFSAAAGACLTDVVRKEDLLTANSRFEATTWTTTAIGPPLGGLAIGMFGPMTTVVLDAVSYLLSALGIRAIRGRERAPARKTGQFRIGDLAEGWRYILGHPQLRALFFNTSLVSGLIMATAPLMAIVLLRDLGFSPFQYGLAFGVPCLGGLLGSRLARPLATKYGRDRVMRVSGTIRAFWLVGLAFVPSGTAGLVFVMVIEFGLITSMGIFMPVFATHRLEHAAADRVSRMLAAWSITSNGTIAVLTFLWGLLAGVTGARVAVAIAGVLMLGTPLFLLAQQEQRCGDDDAEGGAAVHGVGEGLVAAVPEDGQRVTDRRDGRRQQE
jgi:MFS family permease